MKIDYKQIAEYSNIVCLYIFGTNVGVDWSSRVWARINFYFPSAHPKLWIIIIELSKGTCTSQHSTHFFYSKTLIIQLLTPLTGGSDLRDA